METLSEFFFHLLISYNFLKTTQLPSQKKNIVYNIYIEKTCFLSSSPNNRSRIPFKERHFLSHQIRVTRRYSFGVIFFFFPCALCLSAPLEGRKIVDARKYLAFSSTLGGGVRTTQAGEHDSR